MLQRDYLALKAAVTTRYTVLADAVPFVVMKMI
jgi:hypothetical protein